MSKTVYVGLLMCGVYAQDRGGELESSNDDHACTHRPQLLPAESESIATTTAVHLTSQAPIPNSRTRITPNEPRISFKPYEPAKMVHIAAASHATEH
jgi:hypothetical protein